MNERIVPKAPLGRYTRILTSVALTLLMVAALAAPALAQTFLGDALPNVMVGTRLADEMDGAGGNDSLHGKGGDDAVHGGSGKDYLSGGAGDDSLYPGDDGFRDDVRCGPGNDTVYAGGFDHSRNNIPLSCENVESI